MGSYKWGHKSPNMAYKYSCPTPLIATHEPPSKGPSDLSSCFQGGNFFISSSGNLKMGDFGIAKAGNVSELPQKGSSGLTVNH